jgi:hypothetical protein|tara:strand:- start:342 stop:506 length:165 start_codon:yes stop_codon:yes gene_type:complete
MTTVEEVEAYPLPGAEDFDATQLVEHLRDHQEFAVCGGINAARRMPCISARVVA